MDELIARNRLLKEIREVYEYDDEFVTMILPNIIRNQPTVDAVPIARLADLCERWNLDCAMCPHLDCDKCALKSCIDELKEIIDSIARKGGETDGR